MVEQKNNWLDKNKNIKEIRIEDNEMKYFISIAHGDGRKFLNIIKSILKKYLKFRLVLM